jgi:hypothetical protein
MSPPRILLTGLTALVVSLSCFSSSFSTRIGKVDYPSTGLTSSPRSGEAGEIIESFKGQRLQQQDSDEAGRQTAQIPRDSIAVCS